MSNQTLNPNFSDQADDPFFTNSFDNNFGSNTPLDDDFFATEPNDGFYDDQANESDGTSYDGEKNIKVDLSKKNFEPITKFFEDMPADFFNDPTYYKTALSNENQSAQRVHAILSKYLKCADPKDRAIYRQQMVTAYWEFFRSIAPKMSDEFVAMPKRMLVRYGVLLPSLFAPEQKDMFSKAILTNNTGEPVFYLDEWLKEIALGHIAPSATDEARPQHKMSMTADELSASDQQRLMQLQSKNSGKLQSAESLLTIKENERSLRELELKSRVEQLLDHQPIIGLEPHKRPLSDAQKRLFGEISERLRALSKIDKDLAQHLRDYQEAKEVYDSVQDKLAMGAPITSINKNELTTEIATIRQMAKMSVGRQGNQFPIFSREFFHCLPKETGFRENVISTLAWIESIDPECFCRTYKNVLNRIVPFVILMPSYGDFGFCWEPFDRYNRITSRGRIVIPMYPKSLQISILRAVADLRWQVAKEKASYYWMQEGLTGMYYQWVDAQKLKGDLKSFFIEDYILWITKESKGVQRLDKTVRGIFWRYMPFPQALKDDLKRRSPVYAELCQKDANRAMSDGY